MLAGIDDADIGSKCLEYYEKSLDPQAQLGHGMGSRVRSSTSNARAQRDERLLNSHRPGTETTSHSNVAMLRSIVGLH